MCYLVTSNILLLDLHSVDPPKIIQHPENHSVATGADTMFTVETTGDKLQFQWQKDGIDIVGSKSRLQYNSTGNASTLYIKDTNKGDKGHYRCLITNPVERRGLLSAAAYLSVCKSVILLLVLSRFHVTAFFHLSFS